MNIVHTKYFFYKHRGLIGNFLICLGIVAFATLIFALRYRPAFDMPNFYAEDGRVFVNNILHKNIIGSLFTGFNGYLIVGEYLVLDVAVAIYRLFDMHFYQLAYVIPAASCLFMGLTVSLPYILFRKELGKPLALAAVALGRVRTDANV